MDAVGKCPHCRERISAWRLLRVSRATPYVCGKCGGEALIAAPSGRRAAIIYVLAIALPLLALSRIDVSDVVLYAAATAAALAIPIFFARLCRFESTCPPTNTVES